MARPSQVLIRIHGNAAFAYPIIRKLKIMDEEIGKKPSDDEPRFKLDELTEEAAVLINETRQIDMKKLGMAPVRKGRGDTGVQVFGSDGVANCSVGSLITDLIAAGYQFVDAHHKMQPFFDRQTGRPTGEQKVVITFTFSREPDEEPQEEEFLREIIEFFADLPFRHGHVWQNTNANNDSVDLTGSFDLSVGKYKRLRFGADGTYKLDEVVKPRPARAERNA